MSIQRFPHDSTAAGGGPPYSKAVRAGDLYFLAGQVGVDALGRLAEGGIAAEARQTIENIDAVLASLGLGLEDVVKATVWLTDPADFDTFNAVYRTYFGAELPARACVRAELMGPYRVEIEVIAAARQEK
ncbi:RidA family protein [Pelagibius marinus]|uniref:RidA family protein n=1 Tax=Pelagibius marinus TaxID=2762760 RepID=UPI0018722F80|nr:RidA family protein [Pelagibius marinus]